MDVGHKIKEYLASLDAAPSKQVFPEKISFDGEKFGTTKMSLIYELDQEDGVKDSNLVTPTGIEPVFTP